MSGGFKQEINCVPRVFDKCPGVIFQKLVRPGGILRFALVWGCIFIIWNSTIEIIVTNVERYNTNVGSQVT